MSYPLEVSLCCDDTPSDMSLPRYVVRENVTLGKREYGAPMHSVDDNEEVDDGP